jgi:hypothetical protein
LNSLAFTPAGADDYSLAVLAADHSGLLKHAEKDFRLELFVFPQAFCCPKIEAISFSEQPE